MRSGGIEARKFAPFVHKVMPITEATEAHAILERGENSGKIVLTFGIIRPVKETRKTAYEQYTGKATRGA